MKRRGNHLNNFFIFLLTIFILIQIRYLIEEKWLKKKTENCLCSNLTETKLPKSLCSIRANKRGFGQKILSISFFGPIENAMFSINGSFHFLQEMINEMREIYPDNWILRIYHDEKILNETIITYFQYHYNFVDFCNVTDIGLNYIPQKIWRFLPSVDDTVDIMASRDLDSPLTNRERTAINEWLLSNFTFHTMRDHPAHAAPIMGGMWAFRVKFDRQFSHTFRLKIFNHALIKKYSLNRDQEFLAEHLWPYAMDKAMIHASYWCTISDWNKHHRPFPTRRPTYNLTSSCFVGCAKPCCAKWSFDKHPCPIECRPKQHQDWLYC